MKHRLLLVSLLSALCVLFVIQNFPTAAQTPQCGYAQSIAYPIDTSVFTLVQDFGVPSGRHQGRYHTGEDWFAGRVADYGSGLHIAAAAAGRVTYSSDIGWGRDGGVVILEHTFTDGTVLYTQYGHMAQTDTAQFPAVYSCVEAGEVIGAVGNTRPAPHLHFEVRVNNADYPGPGYSWENPIVGGWRKPSKLIQNRQANLHPAYRWHLDLADEAGPVSPLVELDDHSLVYLDAGRVGRVTPDGRLLWRVNLERSAVSVIPDAGLARILYASGGMQRINLDGALFEPEETGVEINQPVLRLDNSLLVHTPGDTLARFDSAGTAVMLPLADVKPVRHGVAAAQVIGLLTEDNQLLTLALDGTLLDRAQLRQPASLAVAPDGHLLAYTQAGLWRILPDGTWEMLRENTLQPASAFAFTIAPDGTVYLFDGLRLSAYNPDFALAWQSELTDVSGRIELTLHDATLLLTSNHGDILPVRALDGSLCGRARIYGSDRARLWHSLGTDGILRVAVADQIMGLDWETFLGGCA